MIKISLILLFAVVQIKIVKAQSIEVAKFTDTAFSKVETEAYFPGGVNEWKKYLQKNLKINVPTKNKAPAGIYMVIVRFIVLKDGIIEDIVPETNYGYGMEKEVMRVIQKGPKWVPATQSGKIVKAYRRQPITFVISEE